MLVPYHFFFSLHDCILQECLAEKFLRHLKTDFVTNKETTDIQECMTSFCNDEGLDPNTIKDLMREIEKRVNGVHTCPGSDLKLNDR